MKKNIGLGLAAAVALSVVSRADAPRTLRVREDQRPGAGRLEASVAAEMSERESEFLSSEKLQTLEAVAQLRYGVTKEFTLSAAVPYLSREQEVGSDRQGVGDVRLGFELVTWRDAFDFPYIMPYAEIAFPTGDEKKGLGTGEVSGTVGIALGSTAVRYTHFVLDVRYHMVSDGENLASGGLAMIHELSKKFAVSIEGVVREKMAGEKEYPKLFIGGMTYKPAPAWALSVFGGKEAGGDGGTVVGGRVSYTFR